MMPVFERVKLSASSNLNAWSVVAVIVPVFVTSELVVRTRYTVSFVIDEMVPELVMVKLSAVSAQTARPSVLAFLDSVKLSR